LKVPPSSDQTEFKIDSTCIVVVVAVIVDVVVVELVVVVVKAMSANNRPDWI